MSQVLYGVGHHRPRLEVFARRITVPDLDHPARRSEQSQRGVVQRGRHDGLDGDEGPRGPAISRRVLGSIRPDTRARAWEKLSIMWLYEFFCGSGVTRP